MERFNAETINHLISKVKVYILVQVNNKNQINWIKIEILSTDINFKQTVKNDIPISHQKQLRHSGPGWTQWQTSLKQHPQSSLCRQQT